MVVMVRDGVKASKDDDQNGWFRQTTKLVDPSASFTVLADCCCSGGLVEGAKDQSRWGSQPGSDLLGLKRMMSNKQYSCFTHALSTILKEKEGIVENKELADAINEFFGKLRFLPKEGGTRKLPSEVQNATLYCGDKQATCLFFEAP
ncbi:hypothetical protein QL285_072624 [Trifolium repens]|nr:hypothetical protein QL285_072624 [Trifolium repens]